jgi:hypothetical protein
MGMRILVGESIIATNTGTGVASQHDALVRLEPPRLLVGKPMPGAQPSTS